MNTMRPSAPESEGGSRSSRRTPTANSAANPALMVPLSASATPTRVGRLPGYSSEPAASGFPVAVPSSPGTPGLSLASSRAGPPASSGTCSPDPPRAAGRIPRGSPSRASLLAQGLLVGADAGTDSSSSSGSGCAPGMEGPAPLPPTRGESPRCARRPCRSAPPSSRRRAPGRATCSSCSMAGCYPRAAAKNGDRPAPRVDPRRPRVRQPAGAPGHEPGEPPAPEGAPVLLDLDPRMGEELA